MSPRRTYGTGSVFLRGRIWWIQWRDYNGKHRESTKSESRKEAERQLRQRLVQSEAGDPTPDLYRALTVEVVCEMVLADYRANRTKSLNKAPAKIAHLTRLLGGKTLASRVDEALLTWYQAHRLGEITRYGRPVQAATVNRELALLRRGMRLARRRLPRVPDFKLLKESSPRKGFFERPRFEAVYSRLTDDLKPIAMVGYLTGWRVEELKSRQRHHLDLDARFLRLEPGETKSGEGRMFPLTGELYDTLRAQEDRTLALERELGCIIPWVFHRNGKPIRSYRHAWAKACRDAGAPGMFRHDFRRTAVRNMIRAGLSQQEAMQLVGLETDEMFDRYAIIDEAMLKRAAEAYLPQIGSKPSPRRRGK